MDNKLEITKRVAAICGWTDIRESFAYLVGYRPERKGARKDQHVIPRFSESLDALLERDGPVEWLRAHVVDHRASIDLLDPYASLKFCNWFIKYFEDTLLSS